MFSLMILTTYQKFSTSVFFYCDYETKTAFQYQGRLDILLDKICFFSFEQKILS